MHMYAYMYLYTQGMCVRESMHLQLNVVRVCVLESAQSGTTRQPIS